MKILFWIFVGSAVVAFVAAGITSLQGREKLGICLGALSLLFGLLSGGSWYFDRGSNKMSEEKLMEIRNAKFDANIEDADKGSVMEVDRPAILSDVKASLKAKNVKDAAAFRTNQGMVSIMTICPTYNKSVPFVMTGQISQAPDTFKCPLCGQEHPLKIKR